MGGRESGPNYGVRELASDLAKGRVAPAYLVLGEEDGLRERARHALESLVPEDARGMDLEVLEGSSSETDWSVVSAAVRTMPWIAPRRVVVVLRAEELTGEPADLMAWLEDPSDRVVLGLLSPKVDRRTNPWRSMGGSCRLVACEPLGEQGLHVEARELLRRRGIQVSPQVIHRIVELVGADVQRLESEVEKLSLLAGDEAHLDEEEVDALLGRSRERAIWDFTNALARGDREAALGILDEMLEDGASELYLVAMAAWNTRRLLTGLDLVGRGRSRGEAATEVKAWGPSRDAFVSGLGTWSRDRLRGTLRALAALDRDLKSSALPGRLLLERFVLESVRGARPRRRRG